RVGAAFGFAAGLGADLFLATPPGTAALAYTMVGHVVGRCRRPSPSGLAAALCHPAAPCFACRLGRRHSAGAGAGPSATGPSGAGLSGAGLSGGPPGAELNGASEPATRPARLRRRAANRRAAVRQAAALTAFAVAAG